jgi:biotin transport system substrate-specific component
MATTVSDTTPATLTAVAGSSLLRQALMTLGGALFLAALSQVAIGYPVPTTLQTLGVMLIGLTFGFRLAGATLATYLLAGAAGLPFFAPFALGTSGYLVGFLLGAAAIGWLADRGVTRTWIGTIGALLVGEAIIFALGVTWLAYALDMSAGAAIAAGLTPFILVDAVKLALAALIGRGALKAAARLTHG